MFFFFVKDLQAGKIPANLKNKRFSGIIKDGLSGTRPGRAAFLQ